MTNAFDGYQIPGAAPDVGDHATLSVSSAATNYSFKGDVGEFPAISLINVGSKDCYIKFGGASTLSAATSDSPVRNGSKVCFSCNGNIYVSAICGGSDTTTLDIYQADAKVF